MNLADSDRAFMLHKAQPVMEALVENLDAAREMPYALSERRFDRRGTYVVVGAGPSLARTGPHLKRLQNEGALICTVNTALKALVTKYDVVPDVVLVREAVDVSSHLGFPARLRVLDLGAAPSVWRAAQEMGPCAWFVSGASQNFELSSVLGARPLFGGTAALTAMVALVEEWGAKRIILAGCDLALADDGASYAAGSAFDGQRATIGPDGVATNSGAGFDEKQRQHASAGIAGHPERETTIEIERWGGGTIRTTTQWADQIPWLGDFAARHLDVECIDATGAGARKRGWREHSIDTVEVPPVIEFVTNLQTMRSLLTVQAAREYVLRQCAVAESISATVLDPEGCIAFVPWYLDGWEIVEAASAGAMLRNLERPGADALERIRGAYGDVLPKQAARLRALLP